MKSIFKPKADTSDQPPEVDEDRDTREIRVTVFPKGGGRPYIQDVEVDEDGQFELDGANGTWTLAPGSVWDEGGTERAIVHEERPQTVDPNALTGNELMHPEVFHGAVKNNLWKQLDEVSRRRTGWSNPQTLTLILMGGALLLLILWQIKTMGDGFSELAHAIENARFVAEGTHEDIAPGGN